MSNSLICIGYDENTYLVKIMLKEIKSMVLFSKYSVKEKCTCSNCKRTIKKNVWKPIESDRRDLDGYNFCFQCFYPALLEWIKRD